MFTLYAVCTFLVCGFLAETSYGATYAVTKDGNDANACTTDKPCQTIDKGLRSLSGGDTLEIGDGTYSEALNGDTPPNGTGSAYTTIKAMHTGKAVLAPGANACIHITGAKHYILYEGLVCDGTDANVGKAHIWLQNETNGADDLTFSHIEIHHIKGDNTSCQTCNYETTAAISPSGETMKNVLFEHMNVHDIGYNQTPGSSCNSCYAYGVYLSGNGVTIRNSVFKNIAGFSIHGYTSGYGASNNTLDSNMFDTVGAVLVCQSNNTIANNVLTNIAQGNSAGIGGQHMGIQIAGSCSGQPSTGNTIYNNTIYHAAGQCIDLGYTEGAVVRNNICYKTGGDSITGGHGTTEDHNNFGKDPMFLDEGTSNLHLKDGSPMVGAGKAVTAVPMDHDGVKRPDPPSIGAYELATGGGGGETPPPSTEMPTASLTAVPVLVNAGQIIRLTWSSTHASTCTSPEFQTGGTPSNPVGIFALPNTTLTYHLSCIGDGGTSPVAEQTVTVLPFRAPTQEEMSKGKAGKEQRVPEKGMKTK